MGFYHRLFYKVRKTLLPFYIICFILLSIPCLALEIEFSPSIGNPNTEITLYIKDPPNIKFYIEFLNEFKELPAGTTTCKWWIPDVCGSYILNVYAHNSAIVGKKLATKLESYNIKFTLLYSINYKILPSLDVSMKWVYSRTKSVPAYNLGLTRKLAPPPSGKYYRVIAGDESYIVYEGEVFKQVIKRLWLMEEYNYFKNKVLDIYKKKMNFEYGSEDLALFAHTAIRLAMPNCVVAIALAKPPWTNGIPHSIILFWDIDDRLWVYDPVFGEGEVWEYDSNWGHMDISVLYLN